MISYLWVNKSNRHSHFADKYPTKQKPKKSQTFTNERFVDISLNNKSTVKKQQIFSYQTALILYTIFEFIHVNQWLIISCSPLHKALLLIYITTLTVTDE